VGPRAGLDGCRNFRPPLGFDPQIVQPVASRYTDSYPRTSLGGYLNFGAWFMKNYSIVCTDKDKIMKYTALCREIK